MPTTIKSVAGRPRAATRTGTGYKLAEWLDKNWDRGVNGASNDAVAQKLGYRSPNIISMWRTGKSKIPLDRLIEVCQFMNVDLATVMPLWFEQLLADPFAPKGIDPRLKAVDDMMKRLVTLHEFALIRAVREHFKKSNPVFNTDQADAVLLIATNPDFALQVLDLAKKNKVVVPA